MVEQTSLMNEMKSLQSQYKQRQTTVVFSQQPIQPLSQSYTSGNQIQLVFQNSRNFLNLSKVQLLFRPVIQFSSENNMTEQQRAMLCISPCDSQSMFTVQSIQINGNQICAQPQTSLQVTRSIFQAYWNALVNVKDNHQLSGSGDIFSNLIYPGGSTNTLFGGVEQSTLTACPGYIIKPNNFQITNDVVSNPSAGIVQFGATTGTYNLSLYPNSTAFEGTPYPRAIISEMLSYYLPANFHSGVICNNYYGQSVSEFGDSALYNASVPANLTDLKLPLLCQQITPSSAVYKKQQEAFQHVRMRFISQGTSRYMFPNQATTQYSRTLAISQNSGDVKIPTATATTSSLVTSLNNAVTKIENLAQDVYVSRAAAVQCKMKYGMSVQNYSSGQTIARQPGKIWNSNDMTLLPTEQFTQMSVSLGELSCELRDIGSIAMENTQVVIQLQVNLAQTCLSAYLPNGIFLDPLNSTDLNAYQTFMTGCQIGNTTTLQITDTTCRIEYESFSENAYAIMKQLAMQPKPYYSIRQQVDTINGSGLMSQRLSIGSSSMIAGILVLFPPSNRHKRLQNATKTVRQIVYPQDCCVNYQGCQPVCDLRSTYKDSYYLNLAQIYAEVDGKRYQAMDLNLANPELSAYLVCQAGLQTTLGKHLNIDLQEYLLNRFCFFLPINVSGDPNQRIQDQQIVITANINGATRVQNSVILNEMVQDIDGQFSMLSFALTMQSLVDCSYVVV